MRTVAQNPRTRTVEAVPTEAVPTEAVPTEAVPTEAVPTEAVPTEAVPTEAVLTEAVPTEAVPTEAVPAVEDGGIDRQSAEMSVEASLLLVRAGQRRIQDGREGG